MKGVIFLAERRMFAKTIIDSDLFLDMPMSTQLLYFHLSMRADDDGFINNPKKIQRMVGCSEDDLKMLIMKQFIIPFESGVVVIKHWRIHNYIRNDRHKPSLCPEKDLLILDENMVYQVSAECQSTGIPLVDKRDTQVRLGKDRSGKDRLDKGSADKGTDKPSPAPPKSLKKKFGEYGNVSLTDENYNQLVKDYGEPVMNDYIRRMDEYIQMKGKKYKDFNLALRNWIKKDGITKGNDSYGRINKGLILE